MKFTVLGSEGFIGSALTRHLRDNKVECLEGTRNKSLLNFGSSLGHVVYAVGVTADFRSKPFETVESHVSLLNEYIHHSEYDSFTYLSSARVYKYSSHTSEDEPIPVNTQNPDEIYNISKLMGESVCLTSQKKNIKVLRLTNVVGNDLRSENFLSALVRQSFEEKHIRLQTSLQSAKDYIAIDDVVELIRKIVLKGESAIYNVGSGVNTTNKMFCDILHDRTNFPLVLEENAENVIIPEIDVSKITKEFDYFPTDICQYFENVLNQFMNEPL